MGRSSGVNEGSTVMNIVSGGTGTMNKYAGADVVYVSRADEAKKTMVELERAALREVAKYLRREIRNRVPENTGALKKNVGTWVKSLGKRMKGEPMGTPVLQVGIYDAARAKRKKYTYAFHAHLIEFGTRFHKATPFMRPGVMENIDKIRILMGKYLKEIEDENRALGLIKEEEEIADD